MSSKLSSSRTALFKGLANARKEIQRESFVNCIKSAFMRIKVETYQQKFFKVLTIIPSIMLESDVTALNYTDVKFTD